MEMVEKSFAASVRVDMRALAIVARWMAEQGQYVTRSGVIGGALKMVAASLVDEHPHRMVGSLEDAFEELVELGLAPRSTWASRVTAQSLGFESAIRSGESMLVQQRLKRSFAGSGLAKDKLTSRVGQEMFGMSEFVARQKDDDPGDVTKQTIDMMRAQGKSDEEIEEVLNVVKEGKIRKQLDAEVIAFEKKNNEELIRRYRERGNVQKLNKENNLTFEEMEQNYRNDMVEYLGDHYGKEGKTEDFLIAKMKQWYDWAGQNRTREFFISLLDELVVLAAPKIKERGIRLKKEYEEQEAARKNGVLLQKSCG